MAVNLFTSNILGPPPGDLTVATELWVDLGLIPTGQRIWIGNAQYTSPDKSISYNLRTSLVGQSAATLGASASLDSCFVSTRSGTVTRDLYRKGRLHIATVVGTGVEHWWLYLKAKGSAGSYLYSINYTNE